MGLATQLNISLFGKNIATSILKGQLLVDKITCFVYSDTKVNTGTHSKKYLINLFCHKVNSLYNQKTMLDRRTIFLFMAFGRGL